MKLFIVAFILPFVFCDGCEEFLPVECAPGEMACKGGLTSEGCPLKGYCMDEMYSTFSDVVGDTIRCPNFCEDMFICNWEKEIWCANGDDEDGCWMGGYCLPKDDGPGILSSP